VSLVGFKGTNHPQQVGRGGSDVEVDDRATTAEVFEPLDRRFGGFTVDVAASARNTKCARYYDRATDGLAQSWAGERVWCNPPYSAIRPWVEKAWREIGTEVVVMLLPANRTEQGWWQELIEPYRDRSGSVLTVEFLPGRIRFLSPGASTVGANERPPFGCCLVVWNRRQPATPSLFDAFGAESSAPTPTP
jgi:phage N-6-adenine-methyltransferase